MTWRIVIAIVFGLVLGSSGPFYAVLGVLSLIPWGMAGAGLGYSCRGKVEAASIGALYGFVLSFAFMIAGYTGTASLLSRLPGFATLGAFGAVCGAVIAFIAYLINARFVNGKRSI